MGRAQQCPSFGAAVTGWASLRSAHPTATPVSSGGSAQRIDHQRRRLLRAGCRVSAAAEFGHDPNAIFDNILKRASIVVPAGEVASSRFKAPG